MFRRLFGFIGRVVKATFRAIKNFFVEVVSNFEAVIILSLASVGTACLLAELPFMIVMPMWIETSLVIPIIATSFILFISFIMSKRIGATI